VRAQPLDKHNAAAIIDRGNQAIIVALDVKVHAIRADDAGIRVAPLYLRRAGPGCLIDFVEPRVERCLHRPLVAVSGHGFHKPRQPAAGNNVHKGSTACSQYGHKE
jgi:hypothetical protein